MAWMPGAGWGILVAAALGGFHPVLGDRLDFLSALGRE
jgi:hypothetical protein